MNKGKILAVILAGIVFTGCAGGNEPDAPNSGPAPNEIALPDAAAETVSEVPTEMTTETATEPATEPSAISYMEKRRADLLKGVTEKPLSSLEDDPGVRMLRENLSLDRADAASYVFSYDLENPALKALSDAYDLPRIAGEGDTQARAIRLLTWLSDNTFHDGMADYRATGREYNGLKLLEYSFGNPEQGINCANLSTVLTEMLLSQGIYARTLWIMPGDPNDMDNHVVTMAYIPEREKWIFLDPSWSAYFADEEGNVLSPPELRDRLAASLPVVLNREAQRNGVFVYPNDPLGYIHYLAKDLHHFFTPVAEPYCYAAVGSRIYLCPQDLDLSQWHIANERYRNEQNQVILKEGELEEMERSYRDAVYRLATEESFWAPPVKG